MKIILKTAQFMALLLTGLSAGLAVAHWLELPNKMLLSAQDYLFVQQHIYTGWGRVVSPIEALALLTAIVVAVLVRKRRISLSLMLLAIVCLVISQVLWQLHNGPVNQAVDSWTVVTMPANWMTYRDRWEYAHAARAGLYTISFVALILSVLLGTQFRSAKDHSGINKAFDSLSN